MIIEVKKLTKRFGGLVAVSSIDIGVKEGEILGLIGPNGAGKTTVFNMIAGSFRPTEGEIFYNGKNITTLKPFQICGLGIARTFQVTKPFGDMSIIENIMVGAFQETSDRQLASERAAKVFESMNFAGDMNQSAHNLTTVDRKKLEVARALATSPKVLLLDEVMAGCNASEKKEMVNVIFGLREKGITMIVIEHDMKTIMTLCDRIVVMHRGEKLVEGTPDEVCNDERAISAYLGEDYIIA